MILNVASCNEMMCLIFTILEAEQGLTPILDLLPVILEADKTQ